MLGVTFGNIHSYDDWGIWLEDTHINPPLPKRYIVDVPARNGLLDLTPELTPTIRFENRTLTFNFRVKAGDWSTLVSQIYGDIHGRTLDVVSDLDPDWHWHGCVTVDDFSSDERTGVLVITVDADPFKLSNTKNSYTVNGNGTITCMVDRMEISPAFELTTPTTVIYGDSSYTIESTATTEKTLSGDIVSFVDGTANPAVDLTVDIEAVQSGTGDPSPDNIRPISGWTGVNIVVSPTLDAQDGTTYPISWQTEAGTVYGGTLDVTTGVLTATHWGKIFDGSESWTQAGSAGSSKRYYATWETLGLDGGITSASSTICSHGTYLSGNAGDWGTFNATSTLYAVHDENNVIGSSANFAMYCENQLANGTPYTVVVKLATPQTYQLTPQQVMILKNQNNIWADSGEVEVTYLAQDYAGKKFFIPDLELTEGSHKLTIQGTGTTTVTYTNGRL